MIKKRKTFKKENFADKENNSENLETQIKLNSKSSFS